MFLILPVVGACDQTDDVIAIFTQGNWKLTSVVEGSKLCTDYWENDEAATTAYSEARAKSNNLTLTFTGAVIEGEAMGTYTGRASENNISGEWTANGKNNNFSITVPEVSNNEDVLGKVFIRALKNAYKYSGDTGGNLNIYFSDPEKANKKRILLFSPNYK